jgi:tetratricopeptide (TPR) repeat protein
VILLDEKAERIMNWSKGEKQGPYNIQINVTSKCNLNCLFCWQRNKNSSNYDYNESLSFYRLTKLITELNLLNVRDVLLTGDGEPMYEPDKLVRLMEKIKSYGIYGSLTTNGTLFLEDHIKKIVEIGWDNISMSIQSSNSEIQDRIRGVKGSFSRNLQNIKLFNKYKTLYSSNKPSLSICPVIFNQNYKGLIDLFKFSNENNISRVLVTPIKGFEDYLIKLRLNSKQELELEKYVKEAKEFAEESNIETDVDRNLKREMVKDSNRMKKLMLLDIKKYKKLSLMLDSPFISLPCYEPWLGLVIDESGKVGCCCENYKEEGLENLNERTLKSIWHGSYFTNLRKSILIGKLPFHCHKCGAWRFNINKQLRQEVIFLSFSSKIENLKRLEEYKKIEQIFLEMNKLVPHLLETELSFHMERIINLEQLCKYDEELNLIDKSISIFGETFDLLKRKAVCLSNLGKTEEAARLCIKLMNAALSDSYLLKSQDYEEWFYKELAEFNILNHNFEKSYFYYKKAALNKLDNEASESSKNPFIIHSKIGKLLFDKKQYLKAILSFNKAIKLNPKYAEAIRNLGECYMELKQYNKAIPLLEKSIELKPNIDWAYFSLGKIHYSQNKLKEAIQCFRKNLKIPKQDNSSYYHSLFFLAICYYRLKKENFALVYYEDLKKYALTLEITDTKEENKYKNFLEALIINKIGKLLFDKKQYLKAILSFNKAIKLNPKYAEAIRNLGECYMELKQYNKAIPLLEKSIELKPEIYLSNLLLGKVHYSWNKLKEAIHFFKKNLNIHKQPVSSYYYSFFFIALSYIKLNEPYLALDYYDNSKRFENGSKNLKEEKTAKISLNKLQNSSIGKSRLNNTNGKSLFDKKQYLKAILSFNKAIKLNPKYAEAIRNLGECYMELKQYNKAIPLLEKSIELKPNIDWAYFSLGKIHYSQNKLKEAIQCFRKNLKIPKQDNSSYYHSLFFLAICYYRLGNKRLSSVYYYKTKEFNQSFNPLKEETKSKRLLEALN